jgi:imidazolonepropionase-like amidohydrolase
MHTAGRLAAAALLCGPLVLAPALGQPDTQPASRPATAPATRPESVATTTTQAVEEQERFLAVSNGCIHTVTGPVLERGTVLCKGGVVVAIGADVHLPLECEVIDAHGMYVYPGLVAAMAGGIHGGQHPQDTTNVYSLNMCVALAGGITTALAGDSVAKLTFGSTEDMILKTDTYVDLRYSTGQPLERAQLRADLEKVRDYLRDLAKYEREKESDQDAKPPDKEWLKGKYQKYLSLLKREAVAVTSADTTHELRDLADLASTYGFDLVIRGAYEGWTTAPVLGRAGVSAVVTPRTDRYPDERFNRPTGSTIENACILADSGVRVAVVPLSPSISFGGLAGRDLLHLNMEAAFAVRGGMSNDGALKTITIDAARALGVDDRVGSLEVGKDADLIVCSGELLHYMTQVHYTIVNGRVVYDKSKETLFAHIRPEGEIEPAQFDDQWPRRLEWPE